MKEIILSTCEKTFINKCINENKRLDGRKLDEFRKIKINFGSEWGSVHVSLGETRVLAQVTCDVVEPKSTRPNEGQLHINVELGPMAASHFEAGRPSDLGVQVNRILERAFKDSRCVDLESLCIVAEEKVWNLRVDINVLNHEGNIIDCASVAVLTALAHFKRPDVTTAGEEVIIHTPAERDPIPIVLHHFPVCVSYAIFNKGEIAVADPTALEERVSEANMVFGLNSYRELCGLHLGGITLTSSQLLLKCASQGANQAKIFVEMVKDALQQDATLRSEGSAIGFTECIRLNKITSLEQDRLPIKLRNYGKEPRKRKNKIKPEKMEVVGAEEESDEDKYEEDDKMLQDAEQAIIQKLDSESAILLPATESYGDGGGNKWIPVESSSDETTDDDNNPSNDKNQTVKKMKKQKTESNSESEEDVVMIL